MASIYDLDPDKPKKPLEPEPFKRGKSRESLTANEFAHGKRTLMSMVTTAFETLRQAMEQADFPTAVKAAQILLDRAGYGPKSTLDVNTTSTDLSSLSREELATRAVRLAEILREQGRTVTAQAGNVH